MSIWNPAVGLMSLSPTIGKQWITEKRMMSHWIFPWKIGVSSYASPNSHGFRRYGDCHAWESFHPGGQAMVGSGQWMMSTWGDVRYENIQCCYFEKSADLSDIYIYMYIYSCHLNEVMIWMWISCEDWNKDDFKDDLRIPEPDESSFLRCFMEAFIVGFSGTHCCKGKLVTATINDKQGRILLHADEFDCTTELEGVWLGCEVERRTAMCVLKRDGSASNTCCEKQDFVQSKSDKGKLTIPEYSLYQNALSLPNSSKTQVFRQLLRAEDASDRASHWLLRILLSFWVFQRGDSPATHVGLYEVPSGLCSTTWDDCRFHLGVSPVQLPIILHPHVAKTK